MLGNPQVPWWISPPWVQVQEHCPSGLSSTYILPHSALTLWCEGTFHATPLTSGGFLNPIWGIHPETIPSLSLSLTLYKTFQSLWHVHWPLRPFPFSPILQGQKRGITRGINITKMHLFTTVKIHNFIFILLYSPRTPPLHITILEIIPPFYSATFSDSDKS